MSNELKPCPFCGGEAKIRTLGGTANKQYYATHDCVECKIDLIETWLFDTEQEAIEAWNTRYERTCKFIEVGDDYDEIYAQVYQCSNCGAANIGTAFFCPNCGAKVKE